MAVFSCALSLLRSAAAAAVCVRRRLWLLVKAVALHSPATLSGVVPPRLGRSGLQASSADGSYRDSLCPLSVGSSHIAAAAGRIAGRILGSFPAGRHLVATLSRVCPAIPVAIAPL